MRVAPGNASRASSSPATISTSTPARSAHGRDEVVAVGGAAHRGGGDDAERVAPAVAATSRCAATTRATAAIASPEIVPQAAIARPRRVKERCWTTASRRSPATSATSSRVVFDPMSMQAQRMAWRQRLP